MTEKKIRCTDRRKKGWYSTDDDFVDKMASLCGWQGVLVYNSLCRHIGTDQSCFPSLALMMKEFGVSKFTVLKGIKSLEDRNVIEVNKTQKKNGVWLNNCYHLQDRSVWDYTIISEEVNGGSSCDEPPKTDLVRVTNYPSPCDELPVVRETDTKGTHKREHIEGNPSPLPGGKVQLIDPSPLVEPTQEVPELSLVEQLSQDLAEPSPTLVQPPEIVPPAKKLSGQSVSADPEENKVINLIIGEFQKYDPLVRFNVKAERQAALDLYRKSGMSLENLAKFIRFSNEIAPKLYKQYAKTGGSTPYKFASNFGELKRQWEKAIAEHEQKKQTEDKIREDSAIIQARQDEREKIKMDGYLKAQEEKRLRNQENNQ